MNRMAAEMIASAFIVVMIMIMTMCVVLAMVMAVFAMYVTVGDFFIAGFTHVLDMQGKAQGCAGQWMITVEDDFVVSDIGDRKNQGIFIIIRTVGHTFKLHADFERCRQAIAWLDLDQ